MLDAITQMANWQRPRKGRHLGMAVHESFGSVVGPIHYSFEEYKICPRTEGDLQDYEPPGGVEPVEPSVHAIQSGEISEGSTVTITDVVATSGLDPMESGFFVQDAGGGAWSGIMVDASQHVRTVTAIIAR